MIEREEDRADDPDPADVRDVPARAAVRFLADPQAHRDTPHERRKEGAECKGKNDSENEPDLRQQSTP
ncbi:MAG: hypothetical protein ABR899_03210 [Candidatus Krumholzibacteriaceae bacterium]